MEAKKPWQSKTMVVNAVLGLIMAVCLFVPQAAVVKTWIEANATVIGVVWSVLGMALRAITKDKVVLGD
jgi:hypothetical protein